MIFLLMLVGIAQAETAGFFRIQTAIELRGPGTLPPKPGWCQDPPQCSMCLPPKPHPCGGSRNSCFAYSGCRGGEIGTTRTARECWQADGESYYNGSHCIDHR